MLLEGDVNTTYPMATLYKFDGKTVTKIRDFVEDSKYQTIYYGIERSNDNLIISEILHECKVTIDDYCDSIKKQLIYNTLDNTFKNN